MLKRLLQSVRQYKKDSILAPLIVSGEVVLEVFMPWIMGKIIDHGINVGDMGYVTKMGIVLVICCVLSLACGALAGKYAASGSAGFARNLRQDMFYNVQNFSFFNIDKFSTASIVTRLTTDVTNLQNAYQMIIRTAVRSPFMLVSSIVMAFTINAKAALVFLLAVPVLAIGLGLIITHAHPIFIRVFKTYDKLNRVVQENLYGIRVVKSFVREDYEEQKFKEVSQKIHDDFCKAERLLAFNGPLMQLCSYGCMLLISWVGARMIVLSGGTEMTTGDLTSLFTYVMQILMSLMMLSMILVMITMSKASAERIVEILEEAPTITNPEAPVTEVPDGSVEFSGVEFSYSDKSGKPCLRDVNLKIASGQTIGIIGGTGSAKSTLVQMIPRLYDVTKGEVRVGGRNVREYDLEVLRDSVAMVLQKNVLFSGTIKENLRWGNPDATDEELIHACELAQADGFIREFPDGYDTHIEQGGRNVSGGQKQRLCIARALLKKPKILILDDSTSAVDTRTDALIRKAFREEIPDTTKFIIAQRISSVEDADQIIVMNDGCVDAVGTHDTLLKTNEIYREVYTSQMKGGDEDGRS
ncbi:MAG: ABC transporter ATP-binding protein [Oscillospiraceae bacterium]|nr:ABC transporter ATP-binding protein [Oscillospiraceae bacterium]MBQ7014138.1 ABC transporter ATP-binding protein [Oscillospiraceae bacterium]